MPEALWFPLLGLIAALILPSIALAFAPQRAAGLSGMINFQTRVISRISNTVGVTVAWATLFMVLVQFVVVVMRYVFGFNSIAMQESIIYAHSLIFMLGAAYTLHVGGHVRVDIFYQDLSKRLQAKVDLFGTLFLLIPFMLLIIHFSWNYIEIAWRIKEVSRESSGLPYVYLLKTVIFAFAGLLLLQGIAVAGRAALVLSCKSAETSK